MIMERSCMDCKTKYGCISDTGERCCIGCTVKCPPIDKTTHGLCKSCFNIRISEVKNAKV